MGMVSQDFANTVSPINGLTTGHRLNNAHGKTLSSLLNDSVARTAMDVAEDFQISNIFANFDIEPSLDTKSIINLMRVSRRSKVARSRLLALRRQVARCTHAQPKRPASKLGEKSIKELRDMRAHIFCDEPTVDPKYSLALRLATHSINMALILAVLPIGAASLTYNLLRGEDMAITARLTTLAGLVLVLFGGQSSSIFGAI